MPTHGVSAPVLITCPAPVLITCRISRQGLTRAGYVIIAPQMIRGRGAGLPDILPSLSVTSFSSLSSALTTSCTPWSTPFPVPPSRFLFLDSRWLSCLPSRAAHAVSFHEHMSHIVSCSHIVCIELSCSTVITSTSFTKRCISRCINRLHLL